MKDLAIIIPAYKKDYLEQTLESLLSQTCKDFHVYIGDDASPFDLYSIITRYQDKLPLTYHRFEKNLGAKDLVGQWERCIKLSKDEKWIWLFSDDDVMEEKCVEAFYRKIQEMPRISLIHYNLSILDEFNNGKISNLGKWLPQISAGQFLEGKLRGKIISFVVEFIFTREIYNKIGGFRKYDLAWGSDFMTWLQMASLTNEGITTIDYPLSKVIWRKSNHNISPDMSRPIIFRKINSLIENAYFIKSQLQQYPERFIPLAFSFRWIRFPLGEIWRNRNILSVKQIYYLIVKYLRTIFLKR
ncbi:MAG: glycosyltransferase family 2 protein [Muribaculaceae bacterium]|nr:glycosyltransferase family 2 protein [Muribaculaceae bacterium]